MAPRALIVATRAEDPLGFSLRMVRQLRYWREQSARVASMSVHESAVFEDASVREARARAANAARRLVWLDGEIATWIEEARYAYLGGKRMVEARAKDLGVWDIYSEIVTWAAQFRRNAADLAAFEDGVPGHPMESVETVPASAGMPRASEAPRAAGR